MKGFCPSCEKESELTRVRRTENLNVKGEQIPVDVDYFVCVECGEEFDNPDPNYDPLKVAYEEYRRRKGMVQPQEIRTFREKYGLTQRELSDLAGFGGATLSRYENGALQDESHDTLLRLLMQPKGLLEIIEEKGQAIHPDKRRQIVQQLHDEIARSQLLYFLETLAHYGQPSILNGFRKVDFDRLLNVVERLCYRASVPKTKLNKLLFYVDFFHFKNHGQSVTGLCYAHLPLGPVPDQYEVIFERLEKMDPELSKTEELGRDHISEYFTYNREPESNILSFIEEQSVFQVIDRFKSLSATEIVEFSHKEDAYRQTQAKEIIPYHFAGTLRM